MRTRLRAWARTGMWRRARPGRMRREATPAVREASAAETARMRDRGMGKAAQARPCLGVGRQQRTAQQQGDQGGRQCGAKRGGTVHAQFSPSVAVCAASATGTNTILVAPLGAKASSFAVTARRVSQFNVAW